MDHRLKMTESDRFQEYVRTKGLVQLIFIYPSNFVSFRSTGCIFGTMMQITIGQHMKCLNLDYFEFRGDTAIFVFDDVTTL